MDGQRQTPPRMAARYLERVRSSIGIADETFIAGRRDVPVLLGNCVFESAADGESHGPNTCPCPHVRVHGYQHVCARIYTCLTHIYANVYEYVCGTRAYTGLGGPGANMEQPRALPVEHKPRPTASRPV